ncbi:MAG: PEP-CTERM sorting domain-containing protein, partial [Burkholderiales bacterium]
ILPIENITVDGNLSDWGVVLLNNNGSNIRPNTVASGSSSPCQAPLNTMWACEDTNDNAGLFDSNGGFVGPEYGGQKYDVEFLGAAQNAGKLFIGIASGLRPDNGANLYGPGDLFLTANGVAYVIEMGGGAGHTGGAALSAQTQGAAGSFYTLDGNGYTVSQTSLLSQLVGSIWKVADGSTYQPAWATQPTEWQKNSTAISLGTATVYSTLDTLTGNQSQHAVTEVSMDMSLFPTGNQLFALEDARWGPSCFNDVLSDGGGKAVPEPPTLLLFGLGFMALAGLRRRVQQVPAEISGA